MITGKKVRTNQEEDLSTPQARIRRQPPKKVEEKIDRQQTGITAKIGKGDDAKNSIVWIITQWTFIVPSVITTLYIITIWIIISVPNNVQHIIEIKEIRGDIIKIWSIFIPILTLILGYLYGKKQGKKENES